MPVLFFFFFKQKTAYEMRISDWSSDVCSSDLIVTVTAGLRAPSRDAAARLCAPPSSATAAALVFRTTAHGAPEGNDEHGTARDTEHGHSILLALDRLGGGLGERGHNRDLVGPVRHDGCGGGHGRGPGGGTHRGVDLGRTEEHTSELESPQRT